MPFRPDEIVLHHDVQASFEAWESLASRRRQPAQAVWKSLQACIARLREDAQWGEVIRRESIPPYFHEHYGVGNFYCIDLAAYHRCFYTIANRSVILLDLVDHPTYDKWFPGRRRK